MAQAFALAVHVWFLEFCWGSPSLRLPTYTKALMAKTRGTKNPQLLPNKDGMATVQYFTDAIDPAPTHRDDMIPKVLWPSHHFTGLLTRFVRPSTLKMPWSMLRHASTGRLGFHQTWKKWLSTMHTSLDPRTTTLHAKNKYCMQYYAMSVCTCAQLLRVWTGACTCFWHVLPLSLKLLNVFRRTSEYLWDSSCKGYSVWMHSVIHIHWLIY